MRLTVVVVSAWMLTGLARAFAGDSAASAPPETELQRLKAEVDRLGGQLTRTTEPAQVAALNIRQAEVIAQVINRSPPAEQAAWVRQMGDCLAAAAVVTPSEETARRRLTHLAEQVERQMPGSDLAAYIAYLDVQVGLTVRQAAGDPADGQEERRRWLGEFVRAYPNSPQARSTLLDLGTLCECLGQEDEARRWYREAVQRCAGEQTAFRAQGALRRLDLAGKYVFLELPALEPDGPAGKIVDIRQLRGKVVIIYFWASWDARCQHDLGTLNTLLDRYRDQGLELVTVSLDKTPDDARQFLHTISAAGIHAYQAGGLDGTVTTRYGIMGLPTAFLVGRTGQVARQQADVGTIEDAVRTLLRTPQEAAVGRASLSVAQP